MRDNQGLTLLETVVTIAICGIVLGMLAAVASSSLRESRAGNFKVQASQVLDTIGRRIAGGDDLAVLTDVGTPIELDADAITELTAIPYAEVSDMSVTIQNVGDYVVGTATLFRYQVEVCYGGEQRRCVTGVTLARQD